MTSVSGLECVDGADGCDYKTVLSLSATQPTTFDLKQDVHYQTIMSFLEKPQTQVFDFSVNFPDLKNLDTPTMAGASKETGAIAMIKFRIPDLQGFEAFKQALLMNNTATLATMINIVRG